MSILLEGFYGWSVKTCVTDTLAIVGFLMIILCPLIFICAHRRVLNQRLHTIVDGNKLFEKLKYDLKISSNLAGIDRVRLYKNEDYARTIFRGAMEYNERDFVWYFNEKHAKRMVYDRIKKCSWQIFVIWLLFIVVVGAGTRLDFLSWMWQMREMKSTSGIVAIWVLFLFFGLFHGLLKWKEFMDVRRIIHDEVRKINLEKKSRVWHDFKIIFWSSIGTELFGFVLILINIAF